MKLNGKEWKLLHDIWLPLFPEIGFDTLRWIVNGEYEIGEISILKQKLDEDDIVMEIGTGLGFIASYCSKKIGSDNVITFEANPNNINIAKKVFQKNNVIPEIRNQLLGSRDELVTFYLDQEKKLASSIHKETEHVISIKQVCLNNAIHQRQPTYLIMDIEGAEYDIFSIIDFQSISKIQFELHTHLIGEEKSSDIFKCLELAGFKQDQLVSKYPNYFYSK